MRSIPFYSIYTAKDEFEKKCQKLQAKSQEIDQTIYNHPDAETDFDHWSKAAFWSIDEANALLFGQSPEIVNWNRVKKDVGISAFATKYAGVRELFNREARMGELKDHDKPIAFLLLAELHEIDCPILKTGKLSMKNLTLSFRN